MTQLKVPIKYKSETLEAVVNPPGPLELPHETQINFENADSLAEAVIPDTMEVWPQKGRTQISKVGSTFTPTCTCHVTYP